ncbi:MAG: hypothetical protein EBS89_00240 [Proteobacteria bacterium]|nr:hypothetical protein [Pseudomonadota bacterium]
MLAVVVVAQEILERSVMVVMVVVVQVVVKMIHLQLMAQPILAVAVVDQDTLDLVQIMQAVLAVLASSF